MVTYCSYNGVVLPDVSALIDGGLIGGTSAIYIKDGAYNFIYAGYSGIKALQKSKYNDVLWFQHGGRHWELQGSAWVELDNIAAGEDIPFDTVVWTDHYIDIYSSHNGLFRDGRFMEASADAFFAATVEFGWTDGVGAVEVRDVTVEQGMSFASYLSLIAESDGGIISCEWYKDGSVVESDTDNASTLTSRYTPSASEVGENTYYAVVIVSGSSGAATTIQTETVTVTVTSASGGGEGGDGGGGGGTGGGGDDSGNEGLVTDIVLTITPDTVAPGGHAVANVTVNGTGDYNDGFIAAISEQASSNTYVVQGENSCNIWVGEDETADFVLLTVTSIHDLTTSASEVLYIDHSGTGSDPGTTEEQNKHDFWAGFAASVAMCACSDVPDSSVIPADSPTGQSAERKKVFFAGFSAGAALYGRITINSDSGGTDEGGDVLDNTWPIEWNTITTANNSVKSCVESGWYIKISNLTPTLEEVNGTMLTATLDGEDHDPENSGRFGEPTENGNVITDLFVFDWGEDYYFVILLRCNLAGEEFEGCIVPEAGLYYAVLNSSLEFVSPDSINLTLKLSKGETV